MGTNEKTAPDNTLLDGNVPNEISLVEDNHEKLKARFPGMNCFRIKLGPETVGRCVGFVCTDQQALHQWIDQQRAFGSNPDLKALLLPIGVLEEIIIFPQFRGNRYSKPATDRFLDWCDHQDCSQVVLNAVAQGDCTVDLVRLYRHSGFEEVCESSRGMFMVWRKRGHK